MKLFISSFKTFENMLGILLVSSTFTGLVSSTESSRFGAEVLKSPEDLCPSPVLVKVSLDG